MAYIPTEWETGDVITAAKLNNMEQGIEDAFVAPAVTSADEGDVLTVNSSGEWVAAAPASPLPEVAAADQGKVLTVDSSGDWAAAAPEQETLLICGNLTVDLQMAGSFTVVSGDTTHISDYKDIVLRAKVYADSGSDPLFTGDEFIFPLDEMVWNTSEMQVNYYSFKRDVTVLGIDATVVIEYATYDGTWSVTVTTP